MWYWSIDTSGEIERLVIGKKGGEEYKLSHIADRKMVVDAIGHMNANPRHNYVVYPDSIHECIDNHEKGDKCEYIKTFNFVWHNYYEEYSVWHNKDTKSRNRTEALVINYLKEMTAKPTYKSILHIHQEISDRCKHWSRFHGKCEIGDISVRGSFMGASHVVERGFEVYGRGRKTNSFSVTETIPKDSQKEYIIAEGFHGTTGIIYVKDDL
jgi:hypothetical protein